MSDSLASALSNPILNGPYEAPSRYFEIAAGGPTGRILPGRRPSESFIPISSPKKRSAKALELGHQETFELGLTGERVDRNRLVNDLRAEVELWRKRGYDHVTPATKALLTHWNTAEPGQGTFFGQREAVETAIYLAEASGRMAKSPIASNADWRGRLSSINDEFNAGLPRVALKMATGAGKTVVMAMLITWQTVNKVMSPHDARFTKRFLVVAPGITIRDRLQVLLPNHPKNYYAERDLVPPQFQRALREAQIVVTNYHAFLPRDAKEIKGVAKTTREILLGDTAYTADDPFRETPDQVVARVLRGFRLPTGRAGKKAASEIVVFNDEAHHCYRYNPDASVDLTKDEIAELKEAGSWFTGLQWVMDRTGIKTVYDLSATPFYIKGSGYTEGKIFPWVVSDYALMEAIEAGIVKVPRTPVDDDAEDARVTYLSLWDHIGKELPKRKTANAQPGIWEMPAVLEGALRSLYRSYEKSFEHWEKNLRSIGEPPPVFIVVTSNTTVSKLVYDWIAGGPQHAGSGEPMLTPSGAPVLRPGNLPLFSNVESGKNMTRPPSIIVDSLQLESGETLSKEFLADAAAEIDAFKQEYARRNPGVDVAKIGEGDLLREVMNTVGKKDTLGEHVRCVVSVSMLTEGWDANTVSHILGIRAFGSQLLCEQVVGRGLRRRSYALNEQGHFDPEYASIYGIPFAFIPSDKNPPPAEPPAPATHVFSVPGREHLRIEFPRLRGYRLEVPDAELWLDESTVRRVAVSPETVPSYTTSAGVVGEGERDSINDGDAVRKQTAAYEVARRILGKHVDAGSDSTDDRRPWLFPQFVRIARDFLERFVDITPGYENALGLAEVQSRMADATYAAITSQQGNRRPRIRAVLDTFDPVGSTAGVDFQTRKAAVTTEKSEISHVVLDGKDGNEWERKMAVACESLGSVVAYVKNDRLGFTIPYVFSGRSHDYVPDFILRLEQREGDVPRHLIVEISGGQKSPGPTAAKATTARNSWCAAVNNHGGFGRWGYIEITSMEALRAQVDDAITQLYDDAPIIGDPDLLDFASTDQREES